MKIRIGTSAAEHIIQKHGILPHEIDEAAGDHGRILLHAKHGYYSILARTNEGRYLNIFVEIINPALADLVSARNMKPIEKRHYRKHSKTRKDDGDE